MKRYQATSYNCNMLSNKLICKTVFSLVACCFQNLTAMQNAYIGLVNSVRPLLVKCFCHELYWAGSLLHDQTVRVTRTFDDKYPGLIFKLDALKWRMERDMQAEEDSIIFQAIDMHLNRQETCGDIQFVNSARMNGEAIIILQDLNSAIYKLI